MKRKRGDFAQVHKSEEMALLVETRTGSPTHLGAFEKEEGCQRGLGKWKRKRRSVLNWELFGEPSGIFPRVANAGVREYGKRKSEQAMEFMTIGRERFDAEM